ncbi:hypothetical protein [Burkholderia ambifaria]|uniref:hypothetical protein n=1 Tax=Burkholderia ambifaria TaxID=152480 RepID=UPI00158A889E|nr:hypothetical protein [Burkholderia ambifaria]
MKCAAENATINNSHADERAANPIGYIRADDLKELAAGNGAIISPRSGDTDVPVFARAPRTEVAGAVREGWKLVPVKPTHSMIDAAHSKTSMHFQWTDVLDAWGAMLAIAPQPPSADAAAAPADERAAFEAWWMRDVPESYRGLACVRGSDGKYTAEKCEGAWEVWQAARAAASQPAAGSHEWDNVGERCIKCGDKDWMADPVCRGAKPAAAAGQEASIPDPTDDILCQCGWEKWNSDGGYVDRGIATSRYRSVAAFVLENTTAPPAQIVTRQGLMDEHWYDLASRHANAEWNGDGYLASVKALCDDYRALLQGAKP